MASLTLEQIRALKASLPRKEIEVPELGTVHVRTLTLREVGQIQKLQAEKKGQPLIGHAKAVELGALKADGSPFFVGEDVHLIMDLPFGVADRIANEVLRISKMIEEDDPKAENHSDEPNGSS